MTTRTDQTLRGNSTCSPESEAVTELMTSIMADFVRHTIELTETPQWRTMDSAPADGRKFDVWCVRPDGGGGARFTDVQMRGDRSGFGMILHLRDGAYWQYLDARSTDSIYPEWVPTHWMEIPEGPSAEQNG